MRFSYHGLGNKLLYWKTPFLPHRLIPLWILDLNAQTFLRQQTNAGFSTNCYIHNLYPIVHIQAYLLQSSVCTLRPENPSSPAPVSAHPQFFLSKNNYFLKNQLSLSLITEPFDWFDRGGSTSNLCIRAIRIIRPSETGSMIFIKFSLQGFQR